MGLFGRRRTTVGLDVGGGWAKLVEVDHGGARPEVVSVAAGRVPEGAVVDSEIVDPNLVTQALQELVAGAGALGPDVVVAMGGHDVFVKKVEMDSAADAVLRGAVRKEAERHVPFDIESVELDYHVLGPSGHGGRTEVLLVAAKRDAVVAKVEAVASAGLNPVLVDVETFALHNAFMCNHGHADEGAVALVNICRESTTVNVLEGAVPLVVQDVPVGVGELWDPSGPGGSSAACESVPAVEEAAGEMAEAVERASAFLSARRSPTGLGRVFLSGSGACVPGLAESLARRVSVETRLANPFERVPVRSGTPCRGISLDEAAPMLMLALGLALRTP